MNFNIMEENPIRRERMRRLQKKKLIEEMRAALPVYPLEEIRNHKMVYHEAVLASLEDRGYVQTSNYIKFLFEFQTDMRNEAGRFSIVWARPQLFQSKKELKLLSERLSQAEEYHNIGKYELECHEILQAAVYFAFSNEFWWWLGEHLFISNLSILCEQYIFRDKFYEALTRYCYGKFLFENINKGPTAMEHLKVARELCVGKNWTTKIVFPSEPDVLFLKVNYLLYQCLIRQVESLMETDCIQAVRIANIAKRRASEACFAEGEIRALMLKGMCQLSINDTKGALETFTKTYYIQSRLGSQRGICEARIHLARAHLLDGNSHISLKILLLLRESAEEHGLHYYLAQSYRHLGEFFLNHSEAPKATLLLRESMKICEKHNFIKEGEQVRNLEAISVGLEYFSKYIHLLTANNEKESMYKLLDWKDLRKPFFDHDMLAHTYSVNDIIKESITEVKGRRGAMPIVPDLEYLDEVTANDEEEK